MKTLVIGLTLAVGVVLSGCQSTPKVLTKEVYIPVEPPRNLYDCPVVKRSDFPNPETATNQQVSDFIVKLYRNNKRCGNSQEALKRYITEVSSRIKEMNK